MNTQDLIIKYAIGFPKRYSRQQKNTFINEIGKDFQACGYRVNGAAAKKKGGVSMNLHVGDVGHAKTLVVVNYDTPQHNYGNPMKYYPFNGPSTFASSFLPIYAPTILGALITLWLVVSFIPKLDFQTNLLYSVFIVAILMIVMVGSFIMTKGVANKTNFNRNTSGVVAALKLAEELEDNQRNQVAFVLTDNGCTNHNGDYMLREALPKTIDERLVIMLDCVGNGSDFVIGYKEDTKKEAADLATCFKNKPKRKLCNKEELRYTSFSFYKKGLLISKGNFIKEELVVENTSTSKDIVCDVDSIDEVVKAIKKYI
ncbi:hypothetical protein [Anaerorhabdus sp.]|uniref:hypothetical protein n=1 Tax=Anaerorhabdus sp. TaxID=1872524 RepID=UPI002FCB6D65